jgi:hypothetical protein
MHENIDLNPLLPDTPDPADFPVESPESRAAARRKLRTCKHILKYYVRPDGKECEPIAAVILGGGLPDARYERLEGESINRFKERVYQDLPAGAPLRCVRLIPRDTAKPKPMEPDPFAN